MSHPDVWLIATAFLLAVFAPTATAETQQSPLPVPPVTAPEVVTPDELFPFDSYARTFETIQGERIGAQVPVRLGRQAGEQNTWLLIVGDISRWYLSKREDRTLVLTRMDMFDQNRAIIYEPSLILMPSRLEASTAIEQAGRAVIHNLNTGERVRVGSYVHRISSASRVRLNTPVGNMLGYLLVYDHRLDMDLGTLKIGMELGLVPEDGLVYLRQQNTLEKLIFFGETTLRTLVLAKKLDDSQDGAP